MSRRAGGSGSSRSRPRAGIAALLIGGLGAPLAVPTARAPAAAQEAPRVPAAGIRERVPLPLTLENIFGRGGGVSGLSISPDGRWLAVVGSGPEGGGIYRVHIPDVTSSDAPAVEPALVARGRSPAWSPDGTRIAYVADGALRVVGSDEAGGTPVTVAEGPEGIRDPAWSPRDDLIAFYARSGEGQDLWVVPADGSSGPRRLTDGAAEPDDTRFAPAWSPDGTRIAYISNRADWWHDDVWVVRVGSGDARRVSGTLMASSTPVWSPDGTRIALLGTAKDEYWYQDLAYLYVLDPAAGEERAVEMESWASDFIMRFRPLWSGDGERVYFPYHERGAFDLWAVPAAGGVATRVTNVGGAWYALDGSPEGGTLAFVRGAPSEGREAWVVDASGGPARRLTAFSPAFEGVQRPLEISYRSFDGLYIQGFLHTPPGVRRALDDGSGGSGPGTGPPAGLREAAVAYAGPACPALVQVHGGGTNSYYRGRNLVESYLAARGFVVLAVNYRGGSGFGRPFQDLGVEDWLNDQARDPGAAAGWLRARPWTSGRIGIYGGSYGGMQTMAALTRTPDAFDAGVAMRGIYSEALTLPYADRLGRIFTITGHGGTPEERPEIYEKTNTLDRMDRIAAPVLLMHGEEDVRAPFRNFELAVERLESLGKEFEAKSYPGEGHGFRDPADLADMYGRLESFFRRHLGDGTLSRCAGR